MTEFIVWGKAPGSDSEQILFEKSPTFEVAEKVVGVLEKVEGCTDCRIQVLDLNAKPDFIGTINQEVV